MITFSHLEQCGRLGNQLWQIASTIGIAISLNQDWRLPDDWSYRSYFSIPDQYYGSRRPETEAHTTHLLSHMDERCRIYMQDYGLWSHAADTVCEFLTPSTKAKEYIDEICEAYNINQYPKPWLSLHVRRGDNVSNPRGYHPLRPTSFYTQAVDLLREVDDIGSVFVFSDDIPWCRNHLPGFDFYYEGVTRPKEHERNYMTAPVLDWVDLMLMMRCEYHVVPNSTYAWWGAYLSGDQTPVYSSPWFGPLLRYIDASLMFPSSWMKIGVELDV